MVVVVGGNVLVEGGNVWVIVVLVGEKVMEIVIL